MDLPQAVQQIADHPLCTLEISEESADEPYFFSSCNYFEDWADDDRVAEIGATYINAGSPFSLIVYERETDDVESRQQERDEREHCIMHGPGKI